MRNINTLLRDGLVIAEVDAHPDDFVIHANAHHAISARGGNIRRHNITLTAGEDTGKNYHPDRAFDPRQGHREAEGRQGASRMGFQTYKQLRGTDRDLLRDRAQLVPKVAELLIAREVDLVLSLSQVTPRDSPDHAAAGLITVEAAQLAHRETGRPIGILTVQGGGQGDWLAEATPDSMLLGHQAAEDNTSQFRYAEVAAQPGWPIVSSGRALHPDDLAELRQYPIQHDAAYTLVNIGGLSVAQSELALVGQR